MSLLPQPKVFIHNNSNDMITSVIIRVMSPNDKRKSKYTTSIYESNIKPSEHGTAVLKDCFCEASEVKISYETITGENKDITVSDNILLKAYRTYHIYINSTGVYKVEEKEV